MISLSAEDKIMISLSPHPTHTEMKIALQIKIILTCHKSKPTNRKTKTNKPNLKPLSNKQAKKNNSNNNNKNKQTKEENNK